MADSDTQSPPSPDYIPKCPGCAGPMWHQTSEIQEGHGATHYYTCPAGCHWRVCLLDPTYGTDVNPDRGKWT